MEQTSHDEIKECVTNTTNKKIILFILTTIIMVSASPILLNQETNAASKPKVFRVVEDQSNEGVLVSSDNSWQLRVELRNPPFGVDNVRVQVNGPFGYKDYQIINWQEAVDVQGSESGRVNVYFDIPSNVIPVGYRYQVCVSTGLLGTLIPSCQYVPHRYNDGESVSMSLR